MSLLSIDIDRWQSWVILPIEPVFPLVLHKSVPLQSLAVPYEPFRFWLRIRGDIRIWKTTPSYQLRVLVIRGVADSPYQWYAESLTPRIVDTGSRLLNFLKENSPYRWQRESSTPRISDTVSRRLPVSLSRRLPVSLSRGIDDSIYHWDRELTTPLVIESGSRHSLYWWVAIW